VCERQIPASQVRTGMPWTPSTTQHALVSGAVQAATRRTPSAAAVRIIPLARSP
jgi:hypothetical protein